MAVAECKSCGKKVITKEGKCVLCKAQIVDIEPKPKSDLDINVALGVVFALVFIYCLNSDSYGLSMFAWIVVVLFIFWIMPGPKEKQSKKKKTKAKAKAKTTDHEATYKNKAYYSLKFSYKKANDEVSQRVVHVTSGKRGDYFKGFCTLRNEPRQFRFDRVMGDEVVDLKTGVVMHPAVWRYQFQGTAAAKAYMEKSLSNR